MAADLHRLLWAFWRARQRRFADRAALERHQARRWQNFVRQVLPHSAYFRPWLGQPLAHWPQMDKGLAMRHFDQMNTAGLRLDDVLACARAAERSRDFQPMLGGYSVGLSSGTSGGRGVFVASARERAQWAGLMLARLLPGTLLQRHKVALLLRADNRLYGQVRTPWLQFAFFDLFEPLAQHVARLQAWQPSILVAPAQVLRALALEVRAGRLCLPATRAISVAEVLEPCDRGLLEKVFPPLAEVYQATEGFLAATCAHGRLHLNEDYLIIEPQWLDGERFVPLITDFTRSTQPVIRYRLDDVLVRRPTPCTCGAPTMVLARIEGRADDMLCLPGLAGHPVTVFADMVSRAIAQALPTEADYRLVQRGPATLSLATQPGDEVARRRCRQHLEAVFVRLGIRTEALTWVEPEPWASADLTRKRRRIARVSEG